MKDDQQNYTERLDAVRIEMNDATCTCEELDQTLQEVRESWSKSSRASHLQDLLDKLDIVGISYVENQNLTYYINLVEKAKREINNGRTQMPWKLLERLYQCYKEYPTPVKYMQRLVDRLSGDNDPWKDDTLRLRILKRFIKYGNYLHDAGFGGRTAIRKYVKGKTGKRKLTEEDVLEHLDDGVFAVLEREKPEKSKPNGTFGLLKTADNLAEGKFRSGGAIKKSLYLFAMVYNMTYYRSGGAEQMDERTDIVKNLFQDYYANNIMRFISAAYHANPESYENPSGQGINDKNFAEMIYLYFIRCREYGPAEKIRRSSEMIARVKNAPESASTGSTAHYRALAGEDGPDNSVWSLSESDFESYVRTHYNCRTQTASETGTDARKKQWERSPLDVELAQNTAYQKYQEILEKLRELSRKKLLRAEKHSDSEELLYYDWTLESVCGGILEIGNVSLAKRKQAVHKSETAQLDIREIKALFKAADSMLGHTSKKESQQESKKEADTEQAGQKPLSPVEEKIRSKEKDHAALSIKSAEKMSRSALIAVYYYYYNALHENQKGMEQDLDQFWISFTSEINEILAAAYYLPMSEKNIGDVLTVLAAYIIQLENSSTE